MDSLNALKEKSIKGLKHLTLYSVLQKAAGLVGGICLARLLSPEDFGIFAVLTFLIGILKMFSDIGFGVSIIQRKEELNWISR